MEGGKRKQENITRIRGKQTNKKERPKEKETRERKIMEKEGGEKIKVFGKLIFIHL